MAKHFELLKAAKAAHSKEVKALKADLTTLGANLATTHATEVLNSAQEDVLKVFKESEDFHDEACQHACSNDRRSVARG